MPESLPPPPRPEQLGTPTLEQPAPVVPAAETLPTDHEAGEAASLAQDIAGLETPVPSPTTKTETNSVLTSADHPDQLLSKVSHTYTATNSEGLEDLATAWNAE